MNIFGFEISLKRRSRWAPLEEIPLLYGNLQELDDRLEKVEKRAEANRVRISQVKGGQPEAEEILKPAENQSPSIESIIKQYGG